MQSIKKQFKQIFRHLGDSFRVFLYGLLESKGTYKYTLLADCLYTREPINVKNSRIKVNRQNFTLSNSAQIVEEDVYLLVLYEDNLAHLFHDIFFPLYVIWRQDKKKILVSINENQFIRDFLKAAFGEQYLLFSQKDMVYKFNKLSLAPEGRDLKIYPNYIEICEEIKFNCFNAYGINESRIKNIIYGRNELQRKNLLNIDQDFLATHNFEVVALSTLTFKELISLLAQARSFTYMVGAGVFYLLFLDRTVTVLEINPAKNNSWAQMFGMEMLCNLHVYVSQNIELSNAPAQGDPILDSHVYFDESLKKTLLSIL